MSPDELPLPEWATGRCSSRTEVGAVLPTRDGRKLGNAVLAAEVMEGRFFTVVTDAGNALICSDRELIELFHQPKWKTDVFSHPGYIRYMAKLLQENAPTGEQPAPWQSMDTAPKTGHILGAVKGAVRVIAWGKTSHVPLYGWCLADQGAEDFDLCAPTHWMPLPPPPLKGA